MSSTSTDAKFEEDAESTTSSSSLTPAADSMQDRVRPSEQTIANSQIGRDWVREARDPLAVARLFRDYLGRDATTFASIVYVFDGTKYVVLPEADLRRAIYAFLDKIRVPNPNRVAIPNMANVREIASAFKAITLLASAKAPPCWKNQGGPCVDTLVVCSNGVLDLETRQLSSATPEYFSLTALDYPYEPSRAPPRIWLEFLGQVFADDLASIELLQEIFGYLLVPDTCQQKIFAFYGPRRSGKGTTLRLLTRLLGRDNVAATDLFALGERFGLAPLLGRHVATIGDAGRLGNSGRALQRLLSISGEDAVMIDRKLDPEMWGGRLPIRFVIATNSISELADPHGALASRLLAVPFRHSFEGREDPTLSDRLANELPGILNWAIEGWVRLQRRGRFDAPVASVLKSSLPAGFDARVVRFVAECCELGPAHAASKNSLVHAWVEWCRAHGIESADPARFGKALLAAGKGAIRSAKPRLGAKQRTPMYTGIRQRERPCQDD